MLRPRAVRSLLVEEVAALRVDPEDRDPAAYRHELVQARKKALAFVLLCAVALVALVATRLPGDAELVEGFGPFYLLFLLVIAAAAGFRLGQWEKYRAVERAVEGLGDGEE